MDNDFIIGIHTPVNINPQGYGFFIGYILDQLEKSNEKEKDNNENNIKIKYLSGNEKSKTKLCNKCGEMYILMNYCERQGDGKEVPRWCIKGRSGIREPKKDIQTCVLRSFFTQWEPWVWEKDEEDMDFDIFNCISHYDDKALDEIDKENCIMKGCNGKLLNIELNRPLFRFHDI